MSHEIHAERRDPAQPEGAFDLLEAARGLLAQAAGLAAGRAARTLTPGVGTPLKQTLLALAAGQGLDEHQAPGPATLQVLIGAVILQTGETELSLEPNHWAVIPPASHELHATTDAVVLLTVSMPVQR
jgi:quercetin dioxygenase-like cupin family protein